jgi:hypothetical protein
VPNLERCLTEPLRRFALPLATAVGLACGGDPSTSSGPPPDPPPNNVAPTVQTDLTIPGAPVLRVRGDTVELIVTATDDIAIAWIGWSAGPPLGGGDSAQARGAHSAAVVLRIPIPATAVGASTITVWARDCTDAVGRCDPTERGNRTERQIGTLQVVPLTQRTVHDLPLGGWTWETAYDGTRETMYFSIRDSSRIDVLSLSDFAWRPTIPTPAPPGGIDLTPGDGILVVALRGTPQLGLIDLTSAAHPVTTVDLAVDTADGGSPWDVKVTADRRAFVTSGTYLASRAYPVIEYDLVGGTQHTRTELGHFGLVADRARLARALDRSRFLLAQGGICCPAPGNLYDADTDVFGPEQPLAYDFIGEIAVDATASRYLIRNVLLDRELTPIAVADPDAYQWEFDVGTGQTISPDGTVLYFATRYGYVALDAVTGAVRERVGLPAAPAHLFVTPDGSRLVARTDRTPSDTPRVYIVALH